MMAASPAIEQAMERISLAVLSPYPDNNLQRISKSPAQHVGGIPEAAGFLSGTDISIRELNFWLICTHH